MDSHSGAERWIESVWYEYKKNYGQILQYPPYVNARPADLQSTKYLLQNFEPKIEWAERYAMAAYSRIESIV